MTCICSCRSYHGEIRLDFAAPQVGRNIKVFIALGNTYINPELTPIPEDGLVKTKEGCYSLKERKYDYENVRYKSVHLKWQDKKGDWHEQKFTKWPAVVIQHEYDHLLGRLCNQEADE